MFSKCLVPAALRVFLRWSVPLDPTRHGPYPGGRVARTHRTHRALRRPVLSGGRAIALEEHSMRRLNSDSFDSALE